MCTRWDKDYVMKNVADEIYDSWAFASDMRNGEFSHIITRKQLHSELLSRLREFIISGKIKDGAKVPEKELCDHFGISRTPLREALKVMAFEGLVCLNHNRGATVKPLTVADLKEVFPIYSHLAALAGELACKRLSDVELEALLDMHQKLTGLCREDQFNQFVAIDDLVHSRIERASGSPSLLRVLRVVSGRIRRVRFSVHASQERLTVVLAEHERIMVNLKNRNAAELYKAIKDHTESSFRFYKATISSTQH